MPHRCSFFVLLLREIFLVSDLPVTAIGKDYLPDAAATRKLRPAAR